MLAELAVLDVVTEDNRSTFAVRIPLGDDRDSWVNCGTVTVDHPGQVQKVSILVSNEFIVLVREEYPGDDDAVGDEAKTLVEVVLYNLRSLSVLAFDPYAKLELTGPGLEIHATYTILDNSVVFQGSE